jgi:hypothetical protein
VRTLEINMDRPLIIASTVLAPDLWSYASFEFAFRTRVSDGIRIRFRDLSDVRVFAAAVRRFADQCRSVDGRLLDLDLPQTPAASPPARSTRPVAARTRRPARPTPLSFGS